MVKRTCASLSVVGILGMALSLTAVAFYDEMLSLRQELLQYESAHASDFSDVLSQLDEITGSVFADVQSDDWFSPFVTSLAEWKIVSGFRDESGKLTGEFKPGNAVTVAEALKMAMTAANVDRTACTDDPSHTEAASHWSRTYVRCGELMELRILSDKTVDLNRPATRAEVVGMLVDIFGDTPPLLLSTFKDVTRSPYEGDIAYAAMLGIVSGDKNSDGTPKGTFRPSMPVVRAEVAKMVYQRLKIQARREMAAAQTPSI